MKERGNEASEFSGGTVFRGIVGRGSRISTIRCQTEGAAQAGAGTIRGSSRPVERHWAKNRRHCRRFAGRQVRLQTKPRFEVIRAGTAARVRFDVLLY